MEPKNIRNPNPPKLSEQQEEANAAVLSELWEGTESYSQRSHLAWDMLKVLVAANPTVASSQNGQFLLVRDAYQLTDFWRKKSAK